MVVVSISELPALLLDLCTLVYSIFYSIIWLYLTQLRDATKNDFPFLSGTCPDSVDPPSPLFLN